MSALAKTDANPLTPRRKLTADDKADLERREKLIAIDLRAYIRVAKNLLYIYEQGYWRAEHETFKAYLKDRWDITPGEGYKRIQDAGVIAAIEAPGDDLPATIPMPGTPAQVRPLVNLAPETQRAAWKEAVGANDGEAPTRPQVEAAVAKVAPEAVLPKRPKAGTVEAAVAKGIIPAGVEVTVTHAEPDEEAPAVEPVPSELSDEAWLETLPARQGLADHVRARFDAWAVCYRNCEKARDTFARATKPFVNVATRAAHGTGPWGVRRASFLRISDPSHWQACGDCGGKALLELVGECPSCKGQGYHL